MVVRRPSQQAPCAPLRQPAIKQQGGTQAADSRASKISRLSGRRLKWISDYLR